ncbi:DUF6387 family protein [Herbaspirillum sp. GCM10030257]|uniref:DUF6387 family protein n=1 Tax=Herbaspirillum sp. GCM10030257 TaxID=3273393 RepID=UPI00361ABCF7
MTKETRLKNASQLPDWFDLAKYADAKDLTSIDWYWQISARTNLAQHINWAIPMSFYEKHLDNPTAMRALKNQQNAASLLGVTRKTPILDITTPLHTGISIADFLDKPSAGVSYATPEDINRHRNDHDFIRHTQVSNEVIANIDLDVPERLLIESFTTFIRQAKGRGNASAAIEDRFRTPNFQEWIRVGLLPYLDLTLWSFEEDITIPNRVYCNAIFPHAEEGEDVIRKTTAPLAKQTLDGYFDKILATLPAKN